MSEASDLWSSKLSLEGATAHRMIPPLHHSFNPNRNFDMTPESSEDSKNPGSSENSFSDLQFSKEPSADELSDFGSASNENAFKTNTPKPHQKKAHRKKIRSLLEEIKSYDIYTVSSPDDCPSLPDITQIQAQESSSLTTPLCIPHRACRKMEYNQNTKFRPAKRPRCSYSALPVLEEEEAYSSFNQQSIYKCFKEFLESNESEILLKPPIKCCKDYCDPYQPPTQVPCDRFYMDYEEQSNESESDSEIEILDDDWESWVDLSKHTSTPTPPPGQQSTGGYNGAHPTSPDRVTPLTFGNGEEYLRLLREAQKESNQSSARVSLASSRRDTPRGSPKSPPNSPNTELSVGSDASILKDVYLNYFNKEGEVVGVAVEKDTETDWIWDWSSRPDQAPPKEWKFVHPRKVGGHRGASIRRVMVGNSSLFSRDVMYTLLITNVLSLLLGTGIGIWLSKRSGGTVNIEALPIN